MSYNYDDLVEAYIKLGLKKEQVVYIGSSLPYLRDFNVPGKKAILDAHYNALMNALGENGTIAVFTQSTQLCNTDIIFDLENTPSISGFFSEYIRKKKGAYRSFHPFCSYAAIGKHAQEITQDTTRHAYGPESPIARMIDFDTTGISIGLPPQLTCSAIHHVEMAMGVPYRYFKEFLQPVVRNRKTQKELFYLFVWYRGINLKRDRLKKVFQNYLKTNKMSSVEIGAGKIYSYSLRGFYTSAVQLFKDDIYSWLEQPPDIRPYRK